MLRKRSEHDRRLTIASRARLARSPLESLTPPSEDHIFRVDPAALGACVIFFFPFALSSEFFTDGPEDYYSLSDPAALWALDLLGFFFVFVIFKKWEN